MDDTLTVGEVARHVGITPKTVRYYETIGLLPLASRGPNGYRQYRPEDLNRLVFIHRAKALGLTLEEIRELVIVAENGHCAMTKAELRQILHHKINDCTARIETLIVFRETLLRADQELLKRDDEDDRCGCCSSSTAFSPSCTCVPILDATIS